MKQWLCWVFALCLLMAVPSAMMEGLSIEEEPVYDSEGMTEPTESFESAPLEAPVEEIDGFVLGEDDDSEFDLDKHDETVYQQEQEIGLQVESDPVDAEQTVTDYQGYEIVSYEYAVYHAKKPFYFKERPYADAKSVGSINIYNNFEVIYFVENAYHNLWAYSPNNGYIYAGYKKENGKWVKDGDWYFDYGYSTVTDIFSSPGSSNKTEWYIEFDHLSGCILNVGEKHKISGILNFNNAPTKISHVKVELQKMTDYPGILPALKEWYVYNRQSAQIKPTNEEKTIIEFSKTNINDSIHLAECTSGEYRLLFKVCYYYDRGLLSWGDFVYKTIEVPFTVKEVILTPTKPVEAPHYASNISFDNIAYPTTYKIGTPNGYALSTGTVTSTYPLTSLKSEIVRDNGQVISSYTRSISGTSYAVKNMDTFSSSDNGVHFSWIKEPGNYSWKLTATDNQGYSQTHTMTFTAYKEGGVPQPSGTKTYEITATGGLNVRSGPGTGYGILTTLWPGDTIDVDQTQAGGGLTWGHGKTSTGVTGWVSMYYTRQVAKPSVVLDVNAWLDGTFEGGLGSYGTVDVYVNGSRVADDVNDYYAEWPQGTAYEVTDIKAKSGFVYSGLRSGSLSGTLGTVRMDVNLAFDKIVPVITPTSTPTPTPSPKPVVTPKPTMTPKPTVTPKPTTTPKPTVTSAPAPNVEVITLTKSTTKTVAAQQIYQVVVSGKTIASCKSGSTSVAKTNNDGYIQTLKEGKAKITVQTTDKKKVTLTLKVVDPYAPQSIAFNVKSASGYVGYDYQLQWTLTPSTAQTTVTYKSSDAKVVSVDAYGVVHAKKEGSTTVTATTANGKKATIKIKVSDPYAPKSIVLAEKKATIKVGGSYTVRWSLNPSTARANVTFKSSKTSVATVDANGVIRGIKKGSATITATTANGKKAKIKITVKQ